ncbi:MAG: carboxypeptidase-like regulatory domain-containing protein [Acidobacteria bacterium]|nr:carboxypeptidase-like regulatory domain-containing protein [Acidobacteriota bacterium]
MKAVPAALIGILLASVGVGRAQDLENAEQPTDQLVFTMTRDVAGGVTSKRRIRFEGAVESASLQGCYDPANIEWQGLALGFTAERAVVYRVRSSGLVRIIDRDTGRSRYGLRLPSSRLGLVQDGDGGSRAMSRVTSSVAVIDGTTEKPVPGARVLLLADQGRAEPLVCLLDTDSDGAAVLPLAQRVFATVVAAEDFVGGAVAPDRSGTVRLTRSRTINGRVEGGKPWGLYDLQRVKLWDGRNLVAAIPHREPDGENEDIVAAALVGPDGEFSLHGVHPSTSRVLLGVFRADSLIATSPHVLSGSPAIVHAGDASVAFTSPDPDTRAALRLLRLADGSRVQDYALGRMARPQLRQEESRYSRRGLPSGWYDIRAYDHTLAEFFLEPDEDLDLGLLGAVEEFTLEVRGLDGRTGVVWWSKELCFDDERGGGIRTAFGPQQLVTLWIPEGCKHIWGQVQAPGMVADHFNWDRGDPLEAVVTLRPGFTIAGTVWAPNGRPLEKARVSAFDEYELSRSRNGRYPRPAASNVVDEAGRFELTVDHRSAFFVRAVHSGYFAPPHRVDLSADPAPDLIIEARPGADVAGVVRSPSGRPVEGATVHWCYVGHEPIVLPSTYAGIELCQKQRPASRDRAELALWHLEGAQTIRTDAAGAFRAERKNVLSAALFTALPPGEIEFTVRPWAGHAETSIHKLEPGDNEIEITVRKGNSIEGQVLGLPEGSPTAEVHLATGAGPDVWTRWSTKTAQAVGGAFLFENLEAGTRPYHLYATAPGYQSLESQVVLRAGDGARAVTLKLVPNSSVIEGSIDLFELGSDPRLTAISRTAEERTAAIDAGGTFAFTDLPVGEWRLVLTHGVPSRHEQITLRRGIALANEGDRERLDIDLGSLPTLHFVGRERGVLRIHGLGEHDWVFGPMATVSVDETGQATIHAPFPGSYRVSYQTRPGPDGSSRSYALYNQRLEGTQTFHLEDFESDDY